MLSIANEVDPLIFRCVCFVCDTNYVLLQNTHEIALLKEQMVEMMRMMQ